MGADRIEEGTRFGGYSRMEMKRQGRKGAGRRGEEPGG